MHNELVLFCIIIAVLIYHHIELYYAYKRIEILEEKVEESEGEKDVSSKQHDFIANCGKK